MTKEIKRCTNPNCENPNLLATTEYFYKQKKYDKQGEPYYDLSSWCKSCKKKSSSEWQQSINPERRRAYFRKCDSSEKRKKIKRDFAKKQKENGYYKKYQQENKDKFQQYRFEHMHKKHDITDVEWEYCKEYFDNSCAYCGKTEAQSKEEYGHVLHMEHAINNGANDITNCVPACRSCNSQKWIRDFNEWYIEGNIIYSVERYGKITKWMEKDCFKNPIN
jgi:5-methylcytosine-specific restriction endonuclease McrA